MARPFDKRAIHRENERIRRAAALARRKALVLAIRQARAERRDRVRGVRLQCRRARERLRENCRARAEREAAEGAARTESARAALRQEDRDERLLREAVSGRRGRPRATAREKREEADERVRTDLPEDLRPVWDRVKKHIRGSDYRSRGEAFLQWAEENPDEVSAIVAEREDEAFRRLLAEHEALEREQHRARRRSGGGGAPF